MFFGFLGSVPAVHTAIPPGVDENEVLLEDTDKRTNKIHHLDHPRQRIHSSSSRTYYKSTFLYAAEVPNMNNPNNRQSVSTPTPPGVHHLPHRSTLLAPPPTPDTIVLREFQCYLL